MTTTELRTLTRKELETMAKRFNVSGRHAMKKEELVRTLVSVRRKKTKTIDHKSNNGVSPANGKSRKSPGINSHTVSTVKKPVKNGQPVKPPAGRPPASRPNRLMSSGFSKTSSSANRTKDRLRVQVLDSHWLHAVWSVSQRILDRARVALGVEWHQAVPIIRVYEICGEDESSGATIWVKDIEIQGNVDHWYIPVESASCTYTLQIGYRTAGGNFFTLARSNKVTTPQENSPEADERDHNGRQSSRNNDSKHTGSFGSDEIYGKEAQPPLWENGFNSNSIEENANGSNGNGSDQHESNKDHQMTVHTELIIHGKTHPDSELTYLGDAVSLDENGRFSFRIAFPEGRHVIPVAAVTPDGKEKYTTVLGIMRNTKELGPQSMEEPLL
jgi:hypothetical protein